MTATYHHGNLRPVLVEQAVALARSSGPDGVVLREVARRAGVSHNAAYRHFADRQELLTEVAGVAMDRLEDAMRRRMEAVSEADPVSGARGRLRAVGTGYVDFAVAEPGLFTVAFATFAPSAPDSTDGADSTDGSGLPPPEGGPYGLLNQVLDELVACGGMPEALRPGAEVTCWSLVHGFAVLQLDGPLRGLPAQGREALLAGLLDVAERGLTLG